MVQKKLTALVLALALTLVLAACGSNKSHHGTGNPMSHGADRWADSSVTYGGTYTYSGGNLTLTGTTVSENNVCAMQVGDKQSFTVTTLTADTLIFNGDNDRIYKCQGDCDDTTGEGKWKMSPKDTPWETDYLTVKDDGTFTVKISGLNCANGYSYYECKDGRYYLDVWVNDPNKLLTAPKLSGSETLIGSTIDLGWAGWGWYSYGNQLLATPDDDETFTLTLVEGTTTYTIKDHQNFYNDCAGCLDPLDGEHLDSDTVTFVWGGVPHNSNFVDYYVEFSGQGMDGETVIYNRETHSVTFGEADTNDDAWGHWNIETDYTSGETDQSCGSFHTY